MDNKENNIEEIRKGNKIGIIIIVSFIIFCLSFLVTLLKNNILSGIVYTITGFIPILDLFLLIYGRIKYPKNKLLFIMMIFSIVIVVLACIGFAILIHELAALGNSCS